MSEQCTHDCSTCSSACSERKPTVEKPHELSRIKKVVGVVSGKGGVGKSMVTAMSAVVSERLGYKTAVLDADVTGPSIPKMFGIKTKAEGNDLGILPAVSAKGVKIMSLNLLVENETDPVVWRGPVIAGMVKQFWTDVIWGDVDFMFVDMPPGTGDVPLTVFQSLPVDGIIVVASPQELVSMIVEKAVKMADMMHIPVLGLVENMSYLVCPDCGKQIKIFGDSHIEEIALNHSIPLLARVPLDPKLSSAADAGLIELTTVDYFDAIASVLDGLAK